jgi:hypothetical protein
MTNGLLMEIPESIESLFHDDSSCGFSDTLLLCDIIKQLSSLT